MSNFFYLLLLLQVVPEFKECAAAVAAANNLPSAGGSSFFSRRSLSGGVGVGGSVHGAPESEATREAMARREVDALLRVASDRAQEALKASATAPSSAIALTFSAELCLKAIPRPLSLLLSLSLPSFSLAKRISPPP